MYCQKHPGCSINCGCVARCQSTTKPQRFSISSEHLLALRQLALRVPQLACQLLHARLGVCLTLLRCLSRSPVARHVMGRSVQRLVDRPSDLVVQRVVSACSTAVLLYMEHEG